MNKFLSAECSVKLQTHEKKVPIRTEKFGP